MAFTESLILLQKGHFLSSGTFFPVALSFQWHFLSSGTFFPVALSFQFIQKIVYLFFKWGTLAQKKGHFFHITFKKVGGGHMSPLSPPRSCGPWVVHNVF
jgi:hypothetical protein